MRYGVAAPIVVGTMISFVYDPLRPNKGLPMRAWFLQLSLLACSQAVGMDRNKTPGLGWSPRFSPGTDGPGLRVGFFKPPTVWYA